MKADALGEWGWLIRLVAAVVLALLSAIHPSDAQQAGNSAAMRTDASRLTLSPGDVIRIEVWQQKEYGCECLISSDGSISHPIYRELKVTGVPLAEVENKLRVLLGRYLNSPTFEIQPLLRIVVAGEVRQPNIYTVPPGTTVAQALFRAGGPTDRGRLEDVRVIRTGASQKLDLTRPDGTGAQLDVHSGDQILVGRRRSLMQDVIAPSSSVLAALASITAVIIQINTSRR